MLDKFGHNFFMKEALKEAYKALEEDEIPVGAVIVSNNRLIAKAHNQVERLNDSTAHAEMIALTSAMNTIGSKYLDECILYVTLEPCPMCAAACNWSKLGKLVYGAGDIKNGYRKFDQNLLHPKTKVTEGILKDECSELMVNFFVKLRNKPS